MEGKGIKVFGVVMALLLAFSLAATFSVSSTSVVSAGTQKWSKISVPGIDDMQLAPDTDISAIAVSPDGATLFAGVYAEPTCTIPGLTPDNWYVFKSIDGGYTWDNTGYVGDGTPNESIIDIEVSPAWEDDEIVVVATAQDLNISENKGKTFKSMGAAAAGVGTISSMNIGLDDDGDATYVIGTSSDVYILSGFSGWTRQLIYNSGWTNSLGLGVLQVAFSPNYAEDGTVLAIIRGLNGGSGDATEGTHLRAETDINVHNWGAYINDAKFKDQESGLFIAATSACMDFADDYNSVPAVFVGLSNGAGGTSARGDAFRVDLTSGLLGTSAVEDLDIRGSAESATSRTNVTSIQVSGDAATAYILVGLRDLANAGPMNTWVGQVHYSQNGGESWLQCYKPPTGLAMGGVDGYCAPQLVMAPDFADSGIVYCGNGYLPTIAPVFMSGFSVSTTMGTTFNGRGLLDYYISDIKDLEPSPSYDEDNTLFMVTQDTNAAHAAYNLVAKGSLWETKDGGSKWEMILGMTLAIPAPGVHIDTVEIPATYPDSPAIFVNGPNGRAGAAVSAFVRSTDEGNLFATVVRGPYTLGGSPLVIDAWKVIDQNTMVVASGNTIWKTTDMGAHWVEAEDANLGTNSVLDLKLYNDTTVLVGTRQGRVYICQNLENDFSFVQVDEGPGAVNDSVRVAFDTNFDENGMVYAGINGTNRGVWRIDTSSGDKWEQIYSAVGILSIACDGNGILWATTSDGKPIREVNPTDVIDNINFQQVTSGLDTLDFVWYDVETAPMQTYVFAYGQDKNSLPTVWAYIDTLIKTTLISPACGTTAAGSIIEGNSLARVSLVWDDLAKARAYDYQVAYDTAFGSIAAEGTINGSQVAVSLFLGEQFYWRVRVNGSVWSQWSDTCSFTTPLGPASAKPIVTYPGAVDSHTDIECPLTLTWTSAVEATGFELVLAKNCDWANPVINLTGSSALGTETCYNLPNCLDEGASYCWKVRAVNADTDTMSPWSDTGTFTTHVTPAPEETGTPVWVWVVIALSAVLLVGVVVLIVRTRRPV